MANKLAKYTYKGINQDISKSKHAPQYYFEGKHIKIVSTDSQSNESITNEKGTEVVISLPEIKITSIINPAVQANDITDNVIINDSVTTNVLINDYFVHDINVTITSQPNKGTVTINSDNTITYTNTEGLIGLDSYIYQITDGVTTDTATVTISVKAEIIIINPTDDQLDDLTRDKNYDGQFYHYILKPCNPGLSKLRVKSISKINLYEVINTATNEIGLSKKVYTILGKNNTGKSGRLIFSDKNLTSTPYTLGESIGTVCLPELTGDLQY